MKLSANGCRALARVSRLVPGDSDTDFRETLVLRSDGAVLETFVVIDADSGRGPASPFKRVAKIKPELLDLVLADPERWVASKVGLGLGWERVAK